MSEQQGREVVLYHPDGGAMVTRAGVDLTPAPAAEPAAETTSLVRLAIERGVPVEIVERMVALEEHVADRAARAAYFAALARFQAACPPIRKTKKATIVSKKTGTKFSYTYAPLDEVASTIRPHLEANDLSYNWTVRAEAGSLIVSAHSRHIDGHCEVSEFPVPIDKSGRMSDAQAGAAALTFGKRQSLLSVFGLTTADDDVDGAGDAEEEEVELVTEDQLAQLKDLIDSPDQEADFLAWIGAASLREIPAEDFNRALNGLRTARQRQRK
jgi:acetylornithine deacetylase/succinyl-diaminopimelate desuccinylase-like protein